MIIAGRKVGFSGQFNTGGQSTRYTSSQQWGIDLELIPGDGAVRGRVTSYLGGGWTSDLFGHLTSFGRTNAPRIAAGNYTLLLPACEDVAAGLCGQGFGTITVDRTGQAKLKGTLADGQAWTAASLTGTNGHWPVYVALDKKLGTIIGWLNFSNAAPGAIGGTLTWIKPPVAPLFTNGIAAELATDGFRYTAPSATNPLLSWTNGLLSIAGGNLAAPRTNDVILSTLGKFSNRGGSISNLTFSLSTKIGSFKGSFRHPVTARTTKYSGVLLKNQNLGGGFFLGTNQGGILRLREDTQ